MTRQDWIDLADELEEKAIEALANGDELKYEFYRARARTALANAFYNADPGEEEDA